MPNERFKYSVSEAKPVGRTRPCPEYLTDKERPNLWNYISNALRVERRLALEEIKITYSLPCGKEEA